MTEIKERIQELNKALQLEIDNLLKLEEIAKEMKNKIISIRGGIAELSRMQNMLNKKVIDVVNEEVVQEGELVEDDEEEWDEG